MVYELDFAKLDGHPLLELIGRVITIQDKGITHHSAINTRVLIKYVQDMDVVTELFKRGIEIQDKALAVNEQLQLLLGLNKLCQANLLRPSGTERQQSLTNIYEPARTEITESLQKLGHINEVKPENLQPDALLLLGAAEAGVKMRLSALNKYLHDDGLQPKAIYLLGGQRPLWAMSEPATAELLSEKLGITAEEVNKTFNEIAQKLFPGKEVAKLPSKEINQFREETMNYFKESLESLGKKWPTEMEMMEYICHQDSKLKEYGINIIAVDTPMQPDGKGGERRPNTADTIRSFSSIYDANQSASKTTVLAISGQPHIPYQRAAIEDILSQDLFKVEVIGATAPYGISLAIGLDAVARTVYTSLPIIAKVIIDEHLDKKWSWVDTVSNKSNQQPGQIR